MLANPNDDILITARDGVFTDILVVRGFFTKITLCVYGYLLKDDAVREKCPSFGCDVRVERPLSLPQTYGLGLWIAAVNESARSYLNRYWTLCKREAATFPWTTWMLGSRVVRTMIKHKLDLFRLLPIDFNNPFWLYHRYGCPRTSCNSATTSNNCIASSTKYQPIYSAAPNKTSRNLLSFAVPTQSVP